MTDDLRAAINRELPEGGVPFSSLDVDAAVAAGRAARRRRHVVAGGAGASVTAAAAVLVVMLPLGTVGTPPADRNSPGAASEAPVPTTPSGPQPPQLDPAAEYYWTTSLEPEQTEATRSYTEAFWDAFTARYPSAELIDMDAAGSWQEQAGPPDEFAWFERDLYVLTEGAHDDNGAPIGEHRYMFERTAYGLTHLLQVGQPGEGNSDAVTIRFEGRGDTHDAIDVAIYPAGTYTRELGPLHPTMCYPDSNLSWAACEAEDVTGPDGEDLQYVSGLVQDDGGEPVVSAYFAVLYRPDGSAVVVYDNANRLAPDEPAPYLSFEELAAIAAGLPALPVR